MEMSELDGCKIRVIAEEIEWMPGRWLPFRRSTGEVEIGRIMNHSLDKTEWNELMDQWRAGTKATTLDSWRFNKCDDRDVSIWISWDERALIPVVMKWFKDKEGCDLADEDSD